jgi:hypothetical protein
MKYCRLCLVYTLEMNLVVSAPCGLLLCFDCAMIFWENLVHHAVLQENMLRWAL